MMAVETFKVEPETDPAAAQLLSELRKHRDSGHLRFETVALHLDPPVGTPRRLGRESIVRVLDALSCVAGCRAIGENWREIDRAGAKDMIHHVLRWDLAYEVELMAPAVAVELADRVIHFFPNENRFFTNGEDLRNESAPIGRGGGPSVRIGAGWTPVTDATFDRVVIVLGARRAGWLCVGDED